MQISTGAVSRELGSVARAYFIDIAAAILLFLTTSFAAGRVWRFPFDDEIIALTPAETLHSAITLIYQYTHAEDIHPPLSFLLFYFLHGLGFGEPGMRLVSLGLTAIAIGLMHCLALAVVQQKTPEPLRPGIRLLAILIFGLVPLAVSLGDAIRWYPLFAFLFTLFSVLYLAGRNHATQLASAMVLGLAASTNFLAIFVLIPFAIYRYGLERRFRLAFDASYWLIVLIFGAMGICSAYGVAIQRFQGVQQTEFGHGLLNAITQTVLGFFGGDALGIGLGLLLIPAFVITCYAFFKLIDRTKLGDPVHFYLLLAAGIVPMVLLGFAKPRSFLYLAPVIASIQLFFLAGQFRTAAKWAPLFSALILLPSIAAIANINHSDRPFKREAAIDFGQIADFIQSNGTGHVLVVTSDPVLAWILDHEARGNRCVSFLYENETCFAGRYDTVFVVWGHWYASSGADDALTYPASKDEVPRKAYLVSLLAGRRMAAILHIGEDKDAGLKNRLAHARLETSILTARIYK